MSRKVAALLGLALLCLLPVGLAQASSPGVDIRVTTDCVVPPQPDPGPGYVVPPGCPYPPVSGYVNEYTLATGQPVGKPDPVIDECSIAHGRQNEPAVAVDPRNTSVLIGSSNDYCGVYVGRDAQGNPVPTGPIWLGYYRSTDNGRTFRDSLVPGYPGDPSPYAALAKVRTASAGDPVIAWDNHGRVFMGSESSDDPAGTPKTFGDVWVATFDNPAGENGPTIDDGKRFRGTSVVAQGSSAPNLLGKFNDKTAIEADRTGGRCDGEVYFSWSRFTGNGGVGIYFSRSTDHGATFSQPSKLTEGIHDVQFPDIAVTGNGDVYVVFRQFASQGQGQDAVMITKSTNCGQTFSRPVVVQTFVPYDAQDVSDPEPTPTQVRPDDPFGETESAEAGRARDCGDFAAHCKSGYTFFRRDTQTRATADQLDKQNEWVYIVYDPSRDGTQVPTGTTYGSVAPGIGSWSGVYFIRYDGAKGTKLGPNLVASSSGHELFPDVSADGGVLHALWWDSRNDPCKNATRPVGNCADRTTVPSLDVYASSSTDRGATWASATRVSDVTTNPNHEQFANRTVPFAGDYLWVTSLGTFSYGVWTDWRDTLQGKDPREIAEDEDNATADVYQCRVLLSSTDKKGNTTKSWSGDRCPHSGGIDQNIYGDYTP